MNSLLIMGYLVFLSTLMVSLMNYEHYHTLTIQNLLKTAEEQYALEGLRAYGRAYYHHYKPSLALPIKLFPKCFLSKKNTMVLLRKDQDVLIVEAILDGK